MKILPFPNSNNEAPARCRATQERVLLDIAARMVKRHDPFYFVADTNSVMASIALWADGEVEEAVVGGLLAAIRRMDVPERDKEGTAIGELWIAVGDRYSVFGHGPEDWGVASKEAAGNLA